MRWVSRCRWRVLWVTFYSAWLITTRVSSQQWERQGGFTTGLEKHNGNRLDKSSRKGWCSIPGQITGGGNCRFETMDFPMKYRGVSVIQRAWPVTHLTLEIAVEDCSRSELGINHIISWLKGIVKQSDGIFPWALWISPWSRLWLENCGMSRTVEGKYWYQSWAMTISCDIVWQNVIDFLWSDWEVITCYHLSLPT